jgi:hypothetical protein
MEVRGGRTREVRGYLHGSNAVRQHRRVEDLKDKQETRHRGKARGS